MVLVIVGDVDLSAIEAELSKQCANLPRGEFASKALSHSFTVFAQDMIEVVLAPHHSFFISATFLFYVVMNSERKGRM